MRASLLLTELRISFEELLEYGRLLQLDFSDSKIDISEETFEQIKELAKDNKTRESVLEAGMRRKAVNLGAFLEHDLYYKIPAEIKWFGNQADGGDYGFLNLPELGDVYFNLKHVSGLSYGELGEDVCVIAEIPKKDFEVKTKKSASKIYPLNSEEDIKFMLYCFLIYQDSALKNLKSNSVLYTFRNNLIRLESEITNDHKSFFVDFILESIQDNTLKSESLLHIESLFTLLGPYNEEKEKKEEIDRITSYYLFNNPYQFPLFKFIISFRRYCGLELTQEISQRILEIASESHVYNWWMDNGIDVPFSTLLEVLVEKITDENSEKDIFLSKLKPTEIESLFQEAFQEMIDSEELKIDRIGKFLDLAKEYEQDLEIERLDEHKQYQLWKNGKIDKIPLNYVRAELLKPEEEVDDENSIFVRKKEKLTEKQSIIKKMSFQNLKDLISLIYLEEDKKNENKQFEEVSFILDNIQIEIDEKSELVEIAFSHSSDWYQLRLFVSDFTDNIDYDSAVIYTGLLDSKSQKLFFKKILKLIAEGDLKLDLHDLNRINTIDYQTSEYAKEIDGVGLDYSLSVIIQLLNDLSNDEITKTKTIYDIVAGQITNPKDFLVIDGFFDKCKGRTVLQITDKNSVEDPIYTTLRKPEFKPRFSTLCDGRKAVNKVTNEAASCNKSGLEFWWCENSQCYDVCRTTHKSEDWKNYNLEDILHILNINYNQKQYEILLNVINRANRFFQHLSCKSCQRILKPSGKGNYGFYGVSTFYCPDENCEEHSNQIYLSHCLNGKCEGIIDSRESVKCKSEGFGEECGWYICNNCFACCSSEKLTGRQAAYNMSGQEYKCHVKGHKDRGVICCTKCGNEMKARVQYGEDFKRQLKWFIDQHKSHQNIVKSGQRSDGKWWFLWSSLGFTSEEYKKQLSNLYVTGFNIPDYSDKGKSVQLIAEPMKENNESKVFTCPPCDFILKITDFQEFDYARQNSIINYHENIFSKNTIK